jgi:hypothetical protein
MAGRHGSLPLRQKYRSAEVEVTAVGARQPDGGQAWEPAPTPEQEALLATTMGEEDWVMSRRQRAQGSMWCPNVGAGSHARPWATGWCIRSGDGMPRPSGGRPTEVVCVDSRTCQAERVSVSYLPRFCDACTPGGWPGRGVLTVEVPGKRVVGYVLPDALEGIIIADDVFVVVALPQAAVGWPATGFVLEFGESTRGEGLESVDGIRESECRVGFQNRLWGGVAFRRRGGLPCPPAGGWVVVYL